LPEALRLSVLETQDFPRLDRLVPEAPAARHTILVRSIDHERLVQVIEGPFRIGYPSPEDEVAGVRLTGERPDLLPGIAAKDGSRASDRSMVEIFIAEVVVPTSPKGTGS